MFDGITDKDMERIKQEAEKRGITPEEFLREITMTDYAAGLPFKRFGHPGDDLELKMIGVMCILLAITIFIGSLL